MAARPSSKLAFLAVALMLPGAASADRGGLTIEAGGGMSLQQVPSPYATPARATVGWAPEVQLHLRYGLTNLLELSLSGFFEFPGTYYHNGVTVDSAGDSYRGTLQHSYHRYGALAGARLSWGMTWRPFVQAEVGWVHRSFDDLHHIDDSNPTAAQEYYISLSPFVRDSIGAAVTAGLQWTGDNFVVSIAPRVDYVFGQASSFNVTFPLTIGWTFYP